MKDKEKTRPELLVEIETLREEVTRQQSIIELYSRTEDTQQKGEEQLQTLLNATTDVAFLLSADDIIVAANDALAENLGKNRSELIGRSIYEFLPVDIAEIRKAKSLEIKASKRPLRWQDERAGIIFANSTYPILDREGNVTQIAVYAKDITEQTKSKKALALEKYKLKNILDAMVDGVYVVNKDHEIQYVNPALKQDFGCYEGKKCYEYFHRAKKTCPWCKNDDVLSGESMHWEWFSPVSRKLYDLLATPIENADGTFSKLEIFRDITDKRKAENELEMSEARYRTLFEESPVALWEEDLSGVKMFIDGLCDSGVKDLQEYFDSHPEKLYECAGLIRVTNVNKANLKLYDAKTKDELLADLSLVFVPESYKAIQDGIVALANGAVQCEYETVNQTLKGEKKQIILGWCLTEGSQDSWTRILISIQDVTLRKQAQEELQQKKMQYESLYSMFRLMADNMPDMLWAKDMDKKYLFANKALCGRLLLAKNTDEPIGKDDMFFVARARKVQPDNGEWHTFGEICKDSDTVVMDSGIPLRFDEFGNIKGQFLYLDAYKAPIWNAQGEMVGTVGCGRDVTREKQTERKLKTRTRELDLLLKEVNHRVKNNLAAITGMIHIEQRLARDSSLQHNQIDLLEDLANRIKGLSMVHQMLSSSNWSPLSLTELSQQVIDSALQALPAGKQVVVDISSVVPVRVTPKDAHHLAIIINELATNVVKYVAPTQDITHVQVRINERQSGKQLLFEFKDDGPGFPETVLNMENRQVGLYLVENTVCHSLRGEVKFYNENGAGISLCFSKDAE